jgi:23S rRNA (cytosine1962-C5)-methyltransferase
MDGAALHPARIMTEIPQNPALRLKPREHKRVAQGHPWIYSNEIVMDAAAKSLVPGTLVQILSADGLPLGTATFNPHTLIAARMLDADSHAVIDAAWFEARIARAQALRARLYKAPYYRLIHAEADGLPGLIIDRYGSVFVCALNSAGMAAREAEIEAALKSLFAPQAILYAADSAARRLEGLEPESRLGFGALSGPVTLEENGLFYRADLTGGQKTGWFFDQRDNRAFMASLAQGQSVLDLYCYTGGFALACAKAGATQVSAIDRSAGALALAAEAAALNGVAPLCQFEEAEIFAKLTGLGQSGARYDIVIADPPAFAKSRKDVGPALKGYRKLARLCAEVTAKEGLFMLASCSHHIEAEALLGEARRALHEVGRRARLLRQAGAAPDHPLHPHLPESGYLKALVFALD